MYASEARPFSEHEVGCAGHGLPDCLCDVQPLEGVEIRSVPRAGRLIELGVDRFSFVVWARELTAWMDDQTGLRLVAER